MAGTTELFIYELFKNILTRSKVIEGRFFVLKGIGYEINSTNFGEVLKDAFDGVKIAKKYPACIMLPPLETQAVDGKGWSNYRCHLYFITLDKRNGDGDIKVINFETNTSDHTIVQDWKDMREVAGNFKAKLRKVIQSLPNDKKVMRETTHNPDNYSRITYKGNDRVNGIFLSFDVQIYDGYNCGELADYEGAADVEIPELISHPLHKH